MQSTTYQIYMWRHIATLLSRLYAGRKGTVTIYTVLCPKLGSNFLACMHCMSTFRYRYLENNSFYNIKYNLICSWLYNKDKAAVSPKERWVFFKSEWVSNWLFNVTINDISVIYVTAHRCAGGLKKKLDLRSGSQRHRHFVGFFNVPVQAPTRDHPFYTVIPTHRPI